MFQMSVDRLRPLVPAEHILVITTEDMFGVLVEQSPEIPPENFVLEPQGRGTAPVTLLGALYAEHLAGCEAVIACLTADHYIRDPERFQDVLRAATEVAKHGSIVTLGITPTFPATGYGYIQCGDWQQDIAEFSVYEALSFKEKPPADLAMQFVADGQHSWNSGMFVWKTSRVQEEFERQLPDTYRLLEQLVPDLGTSHQHEALARIWPTVPQQTLDYGIMEDALSVSVIPVELGWSDVGSWASMREFAAADQNGNVVLRGEHQGMDTRNTIVNADRLVATVGIEDMVIIDTPDALLVCSVDRAQDVRKLVEVLRDRHPDCL